MIKRFAALVTSLGLLFSLPAPALAHCPLCTVGVIGGLTLTRWLGIDDIYSGLWLGALVGSLSFWFGNSLKKRYLPYQEYFIFAVLFLLTTLPFLYVFPSPKLFGGSRLFTGLVVGGVVFVASDFLDKALRRKNGNRALFPYQGVIITIGSVILLAAAVFLSKV